MCDKVFKDLRTVFDMYEYMKPAIYCLMIFIWMLISCIFKGKNFIDLCITGNSIMFYACLIHNTYTSNGCSSILQCSTQFGFTLPFLFGFPELIYKQDYKKTDCNNFG